MVEQNESITRLYRIGHTEIEITAPLSMKSPRNLEKFRIGQAKRPDDEVMIAFPLSGRDDREP